MEPFDLHKKMVLQKKDKSSKGRVDSAIIPLVSLINASPDYYTTSSCAGRIVILEQGKNKAEARWIFSSHDEVHAEEFISSLKDITDKPCWMKAESFILHVACRDLSAAEKLLKIAHALGLKRSGITTLGSKIIIEIVSTEHISVPITIDGKVLFGEDTIRVLVIEANGKLAQTRRRMKDLEEALRGMMGEN